MYSVTTYGSQVSFSFGNAGNSSGNLLQRVRTASRVSKIKETSHSRAIKRSSKIASIRDISRLSQQVSQKISEKHKDSSITLDIILCDPLITTLDQGANIPRQEAWLSATSFFENKSGFKEEDLHSSRFLRGEYRIDARCPSLLVSNRLFHSLNNIVLSQQRHFMTDRYKKSFGIGTRDGVNKKIPAAKLPEDEREKVLKEMAESLKGLHSLAHTAHTAKNRNGFITGLILMGIMMAIGILLYNNSTGGIKALMDVQLQQATTPATRFTDVKGCDEVKEELEDVVRFLNMKESYTSIGARLPKGVLLAGPPGVGKTLMARAVAGEAGVPFFHMSGSEFEEVFVGMGAKKVRALFAQARKSAPAVIFIDEIDSVGGKRASSSLHPYANQTINQLLAEIDGFKSSEGIIVMGATNNPNDLDKALTRAGRFDMKIDVPKPDKKGRIELLEHYLGKVNCANNINVEDFAKQTIGFSGADVENMVNQAALNASKNDSPIVKNEHLSFAKDIINMGPEKKTRIPNEKTNRCTAYHEAGHALVAYFTEKAPQIEKITIMPRSRSLGHTAFTPDETLDYGQSRGQILAHIDTCMGGHAAEELIFGKDEVTTGAMSDFQSATFNARAMVMKYGMSDLIGFRAMDLSEKISPAQLKIVDEEIDRILKESHERAVEVLMTYSHEHHLLANALLEYETLDYEEVQLLFKSGTLDDIKRLREEKEATTVGDNSMLIIKSLYYHPMINKLLSEDKSEKDVKKKEKGKDVKKEKNDD